MTRMIQVEHIRSREQPQPGGLEEQEPPVDRRPPLTPGEFQHREEARALFMLGERCRRGGDLRMAYGFYQETHLVCPDCYYGQKAIERMHAIETRRDLTPNRDL
jgi:hypothetical protein